MRWLIMVLGLTACIRPNLNECDELVCPASLRCVSTSAGAICATDEQLAQCASQPDLTACTTASGAGVCLDEVCLTASCGNDRVELAEECDDGNLDVGDGCSAACRIEICGNGITDQATGETCDCGAEGVEPRPECNGRNNSDTDPGALCRSDCTLRSCGDGVLEEPEQCEDTNLGALTCESFGFYAGTLSCTQICTVNTAACTDRCGDGTRQSPREQCDGADIGAASCTDLGYYRGDLGCNDFCAFDVSGCEGECGDGVISDGEACDGALSAVSCQTFGFYGGTGTCTPFCTFDTTACTGRCGDGTVSLANGEQCDQAAYANDATCASFGYYGGVRGCTPFCQFDDTNCVGRCGDNVVNTTNGETCDGSSFGAQSCQAFGYYFGQLSCTAGCTVFAGGCSGRCGDGTKNGPEECEGTDVGAATCADFERVGQIGCDRECKVSEARCDCGDGTCAVYEDCTTCPGDCGDCSCGDGVCAGETCVDCPDDCGVCECGDGICKAGVEDCVTCASDCGTCSCNDDTCIAGEACGPCREECGGCQCGDGFCDPGESCGTCSEDCCPPP